MRTSSRRPAPYTYIAHENDSDHIFEYCMSAAETAANKFYINERRMDECAYAVFFFLL